MDEHKTLRGVAPVLLAGLAVFLIVYVRCRPWDLHTGVLIGAPFGRDFVNFWIAGRLALTGSLGTLTDFAAYNDLIAKTFDHTRNDAFIFSYPPHILLALAPLACLPYRLALALWTVTNLAALAAAIRLIVQPSPRNYVMMIAVCLSPAALLMVLYGHFGGLLALMFMVVLFEGERQPGLAGLCLAALTVKPQFAMVLAIALLGAGRWRCLVVAVAATIALVAASVALFGLDVWRGFVDFTLPEQGRMLAAFDAGMLGSTISPYLAARTIGLSATAACWLQGAVSVVAVAVAFSVVRQQRQRRLIALVVPLAAVLALPYANHYDLAVVAPALTLLVIGDDDGSPLAITRLVGWITPPLAWHLNGLGIPLVPMVLVAMLLASTAGVALRSEQTCAAS